MRIITILSLIFLLLCSFLVAGPQDTKKPQWKGKIEYENGVKVIKNPKEPLYGEITFELEEELSIGSEDDESTAFYGMVYIEVDSNENILVLDTGNYRIQKFDKNGKYLQTIGKKGQGPGEFEFPDGIYLDSTDNIYVKGMRRITIFDKKGDFIRTIKISERLWHIGITKDGNILGLTRPIMAEAPTTEIGFYNLEGKKLKTLVDYPLRKGILSSQGRSWTVASVYSPKIHFCCLTEELGIYGNDSEYKLYVFNTSGSIVYVVEKEELAEPYTKKEKEMIIDDVSKMFRSQGQTKVLKLSKSDVKKYINLPKCRPIYDRIISDDKRNIYVMKSRSRLSEEKALYFDIFNKEGYYLYKLKMILSLLKIKNGKVYSIKYDKDTGYFKVKRYKIKNWDQIKEYAPHS